MALRWVDWTNGLGVDPCHNLRVSIWTGVTHLVDSVDELKPYALLFDRLEVQRIFDPLIQFDDGLDRRNAEFEYLEEKNLINGSRRKYLEVPWPRSEEDLAFEAYGRNLFYRGFAKHDEVYVRSYAYHYARLGAANRNFHFRDEHAVCIAKPPSGVVEVEFLNQLIEARWEGQTPSCGEVISIVVSRLPKPNEDTPWEKILDFRTDPDSKAGLLRLRRWIRKVANGQISAGELKEELDYLIEEYTSYMRLHEIKWTAGTFEAILTASGELVENTAKLRFGRLAAMPFALKQKKIALLEAEMNAPGREISYLVRAKKAFD